MKFLAKAEKPSPEGWALFIGRWQPWHPGHRWLIDQQLNEGKKVWIAIRDMETDEKNPYTANEVFKNVSVELADLIDEGRIRISVIPDIESINIGRGVGYHVIEHEPPAEVKEISATKVRAELKKQGKL
jgi:nicotinamide mononucleotide adenylyltransferase